MSALESTFDHAVQFYEKDEFLCGRVVDFIARGLREDEQAIMIATDAHRSAVAKKLGARGCDLDRVTFLDAREMLNRLMSGDMPDETRFHATIGTAITERSNGSGRIRAYGEMVDLLWRDGNPSAAIRLEQLWNDLARQHDFSLLCAYPIGNFYRETDSAAFAEICGHHDFVVPTEVYTEIADDETRLREVSFLQQRAAALETEVERRLELQRDLKDFIENATISLHWIGPDGTILWANNAELDLLGYRRDEYVGRNIVDVHADREVIEDILSRLRNGESIEDYEARLIAKDGTFRYVAITSSPRFENGEFLHTRCFTRDITDRKRLDDERRRAEEINAFLAEASATLNRSLDYDSRIREITNLIVPRLADSCAIDVAGDEEEARPVISTLDGDRSRMVVAMRLPDREVGTITFVSNTPGRYNDEDLLLATELVRRCAVALENARLYRLAQQANRTKDEFLATLSHELRTPLTAILGWSRMLKIGGLDDETKQVAFDTIERSARAQATLIDDLLDLSRVVTGKLTLQSELVDLSTIIQNAVQTQLLAADAKAITINVDAPSGRTIVNGDPTRLQQIVWNLVSNAIKFSDSEKSVSIELERDAECARILVRDEGKGIAPEFLPHVFEPFRQADAASTRKHGGLGLGLAIVKYIAELHGGTVSASSRGKGRGATFMVTLPLPLRRVAVPDLPRRDEIVDLRGTSVLLVDDDDATRELMMAMLRRCGADVCAADSAAAARDHLIANTPHVVVTDIAMPDEDGYSVLEHVRSSGSTIPVVALTASAESISDDHGFAAWLKKPIDPFHFARVIEQLH